ncbi:MAG: hypothetical protein LBR07_02405 [Puniceicoccales bacterium]|nr:hypothetical protein [Puniceicoccales bacterium]
MLNFWEFAGANGFEEFSELLGRVGVQSLLLRPRQLMRCCDGKWTLLAG